MWEKNANYAEVEDKVEQEDELLLMASVDLKEEKDKWFLDSGCSNLMSGIKDLFSHLDENFHHTVKLGNDTCIAVMGNGVFVWW